MKSSPLNNILFFFLKKVNHCASVHRRASEQYIYYVASKNHESVRSPLFTFCFLSKEKNPLFIFYMFKMAAK